MLVNLLSGLIGAIIGAVIGGLLSYLGSIKAAEKTINALYKQDREKQAAKEKSAQKSILNRLLAEMQENRSLSGQIKNAHSTIKFITEAWTFARGNIYFLPEELQNELQDVYIKIYFFNTLVEYDLAKVSFGAGYLDQEFQKRRNQVKLSLDLCIGYLEKFLSK